MQWENSQDLNIILASNDHTGRQVQRKQGNKQLSLTLVSVYHPCTRTGNDALNLCFLDTLDTLLHLAPVKSEIIMGANINSNIGKLDGIHSSEFCTTLGPHGLLQWNLKGKSLLHIYLAHRLCIMNTFFEPKSGSPGHSTWTSNRSTSSGITDSHMLDLIVCSTTLHKRMCN